MAKSRLPPSQEEVDVMWNITLATVSTIGAIAVGG
jgi:hypothetical protein